MQELPAASYQQQYPLNWIEIAAIRLMVVCFVLFSLLPYGISWDYPSTSNANMEGSLNTKLEWGSLFLISAILLIRHLPLTLRYLRVINPFLLLLILWCLASSFWSPLPATTFKKAMQLLGLVMIALSIQLSSRPLDLFINDLKYTLTVILIASFFVAIAIPSIGVDVELGRAWRGILSQKNELGQAAAFCILLWQVSAFDGSTSSRSMLLAILFSFFVLIMSKSSTSLAITFLSSGLFHLLRKPRIASAYSMTRASLTIGIVILLMAFAFYMFESRLPTYSEISAPIAGLFGKGSDLTGRTDIWQLVELEIARHQWIGLGYGVFWLGPGSLSQYVIDALFWVPLQSHNGYLDILNEQGLIGLGLAILVLCKQLQQLFLMNYVDRLQTAFWGTILMIVVVTNFTESSLFRGFGFQNVFFIFSLVTVTSSLQRLKENATGSISS
ncbi:O-antigen ligase family protein [Undibacterium sp. Jales W-56]|uniref:O-antigen ligase family protein n=1 Tax=Undibacterium sp. Jales W-56 TaxID=2897325 RepID=UPI0021D2E15E|nr:O-antigen ligase family protein [Undibacterium sp. Jales W-56]MCU6433262.1 O-antigen ligase family protein [Undibacterium sp. Jales W-56]